MKKIGKLVFLVAGFSVFAVSLVRAQDAPRLSFDVASIKPNTSGENRIGIGIQPGGRFTATGVNLKLLMRQAYRVQDFQIIGGPSWTNSDRYDVQAKGPEGPVTPNQIAPMIQSLLEERFKLKTHRETRELPVYELTVAKDGSKLEQLKDASGQPLVAPPQGAGFRGGRGAPPPPPGPPVPGAPLPPGAIRIGRGEMAASAIPVSQLATLLSQQLGRTVIDKTGLVGIYDVKLQFTPEVGQGGGPFGLGGPDVGAPVTDTSLPSIFTALQEQLGLKLDSTKGSVEVIVIDSVEKPSEN